MKCANLLCGKQLPEKPVIVVHHGEVKKFCSHTCSLDVILEAIKDIEMMIDQIRKK